MSSTSNPEKVVGEKLGEQSVYFQNHDKFGFSEVYKNPITTY